MPDRQGMYLANRANGMVTTPPCDAQGGNGETTRFPAPDCLRRLRTHKSIRARRMPRPYRAKRCRLGDTFDPNARPFPLGIVVRVPSRSITTEPAILRVVRTVRRTPEAPHPIRTSTNGAVPTTSRGAWGAQASLGLAGRGGQG